MAMKVTLYSSYKTAPFSAIFKFLLLLVSVASGSAVLAEQFLPKTW